MEKRGVQKKSYLGKNLTLNTMLFPRQKRSQVTIFIILAIAIVVVLILLLTRKDTWNPVVNSKAPIDNIKDCIEQNLDSILYNISMQGGSLNPILNYSYNGTQVQYLCYAQDYYQYCTMQKPMINEEIEKEISAKINQLSSNCLSTQASILQRSGYTVTYKNPQVNIQLIPSNIIINIESDLKITKGQTESFKNIKLDRNTKLYDFAMLSSSITNLEARYGTSDSMTYMLYYPDIKVEKKEQYDGTTIYILSDRDTSEKFMFASRSMVIPPGITGK